MPRPSKPPGARARTSSRTAGRGRRCRRTPRRAPTAPTPRVAPDRRGVHRRQAGRRRHPLEHVRDDEGHEAVGVLLLDVEVDQPVGQEVGDVVEVRRRRGEHREVAGPAEPLVALRAVGRYVEEVAAQPPHHVAVQLGEQRVGALEGAGAAQVGVDDDRLERGRVHRAAVTSAYRNPWKVNVGSKESSPPLRMNRSVAWASRSGRVPSSPSSRTSACRIRISEPSGPCAVNRTQPTRFCPKSTRVRPDGEVQIRSGRRASCRTTGGPIAGTSRSGSNSIGTTARDWSSHVGSRRRASMVCPS